MLRRLEAMIVDAILCLRGSHVQYTYYPDLTCIRGVLLANGFVQERVNKITEGSWIYKFMALYWEQAACQIAMDDEKEKLS